MVDFYSLVAEEIFFKKFFFKNPEQSLCYWARVSKNVGRCPRLEGRCANLHGGRGPARRQVSDPTPLAGAVSAAEVVGPWRKKGRQFLLRLEGRGGENEKRSPAHLLEVTTEMQKSSNRWMHLPLRRITS